QRARTSIQPRDKTAAIKSNNSDAGNLPPPGQQADRNPIRRGNPGFQPPPQNQPSFDPLRNPRGRQPGHPPGPGEITVRTLPNGTQVVTHADGTRVMTWPNGRIQVIPPGEKPIRIRGRRP